jgi:hypothetical protein
MSGRDGKSGSGGLPPTAPSPPYGASKCGSDSAMTIAPHHFARSFLRGRLASDRFGRMMMVALQ